MGGADSRSPIIPRVSGLQIINEIEIAWVQGSRVPRLNGFPGLNVSRVPKGQGLQGFQGIEGFPLLTGAFNEFGVSKIQGFQGKYIKYELG